MSQETVNSFKSFFLEKNCPLQVEKEGEKFVFKFPFLKELDQSPSINARVLSERVVDAKKLSEEVLESLSNYDDFKKRRLVQVIAISELNDILKMSQKELIDSMEEKLSEIKRICQQI